jgi:hypothetical protein
LVLVQKDGLALAGNDYHYPVTLTQYIMDYMNAGRPAKLSYVRL